MCSMMRKKRSNSDSELTLLDSYNRQQERRSLAFHYDMHLSQSVTDDDINIGILPDSPTDHHVFNDDYTMDPSQMFVSPASSPQSIFPCSPSLDVITTEAADSVCEQPLMSDPSHVHETPAVIPTQLIVFDLTVINNAHTIFVSDEYNKCHEEEKPKKKNNLIFPKKKTKLEKEENEVNKQWITDKLDLKNKGCKWKSGLWSDDEEKLLRSNIDDYCTKMGIPDPINMIYFTPKDDRRDFYRSISTGINRPLFCIYRKVLRIYDSKNYVGKYTPDDVEKLEKLNEICPNDWRTIGLMLGRSASSVKDRARLIKPQNKRGQWDDEELNVLSKAIHEVTKTKAGECVTDNINWKQVAEKVSIRTSKQCRRKWLAHLKWKESGGKQWVKYDEVLLINRITKLEVEDESLINWDELANGWASVKSPQWLREKWWQIKKTAPNSHSKLPELLEYLQDVYIPGVIQKVGRNIAAALDCLPLTQNEMQDVTNTDPS